MAIKYINKEAAEKILYDGCHTTDGMETLDDVVELWHMIQAIPVADVRPVVRGEWLMPNVDKTDRPMPECSVCGWYVTEGAAMEFTFCPNCGADMRPEGREPNDTDSSDQSKVP